LADHVVTLRRNRARSDVLAGLDSTWRFLMAGHDPDAAAHTLGKLLVRFGEERVVWGTDSIW
jgi:hypothetical protein